MKRLALVILLASTASLVACASEVEAPADSNVEPGVDDSTTDDAVDDDDDGARVVPEVDQTKPRDRCATCPFG